MATVFDDPFEGSQETAPTHIGSVPTAPASPARQSTVLARPPKISHVELDWTDATVESPRQLLQWPPPRATGPRNMSGLDTIIPMDGPPSGPSHPTPKATDFDPGAASRERRLAELTAERAARSKFLGYIGPFAIFGALGSGGMATVLLARRQGGSRMSALKILRRDCAPDPSHRAMFLDECRLAEQFDHPAVVRIREFGEVAGQPFMALDLVDGLSLSELLSIVGDDLPVSVAVEIALEVAHALSYLHGLSDSKGRCLSLVHRDISSGNILIGIDGKVRLTDFGLAKYRGRGFQTQAGIMKGTLRYAPPEQISAVSIDHRADLFSLGVVLSEMLGNTDVKKGKLALEYSAAAAVRAAGRAPEALIALIEKMTAFEPDRRPPHAAEVAQALTQAKAKATGPSLREYLGQLGIAQWPRYEAIVEAPEGEILQPSSVHLESARSERRAKGGIGPRFSPERRIQVAIGATLVLSLLAFVLTTWLAR